MQERRGLEQALSLFAEFDAGATWAIVGHLFHTSCDGGHEGVQRWFDRDPCTSLEENPLWYAPDIVEQISSSDRQEIGFHSYSHMIFDDPRCTAGIARLEYESCIQVAKEWGIKDPAFVFPRNRINHLPELRDAGFKVYRGCIEPWYEFDKREIRMMATYIDYLLNLSVSTYERPRETSEGLINIPGCLPLNPIRSRYFDIFGIEDVRLRKLKKGVKQAAERDEIFHIWTHLYEFPERLPALREVLKLASNLEVNISSMGDIVE